MAFRVTRREGKGKWEVGRVVVGEGAGGAWGEVRSDDVRMGETGRRLRTEQWEQIRNGELRSEAMRDGGKIERRDGE